ncbi:MAG: phosphoribosylaminoimidazolesuccinocarboxamide synthase [Chloroflexi bacterium]|nr:phosphoribosylaminoimidazolesuccinocarboxamide synthase [Chloroflexota bacterium]
MIVVETHLPNLFHRGKVRDTYDIGNGLLLMVATDRISAFDVVLPTAIPQKGLVLARMSAFWFRRTAHLLANHLVAMADEEALKGSLAPGLLASVPTDIKPRAMVVRRAKRIDVECVVRGYLAGSAWAEYSRHGTIHGQRLPSGLREGEPFPEPVFTPTTKAEAGHDQPMTFGQVEEMVGAGLAAQLRDRTVAVYNFARKYALSRGIIIADTKMEFGLLEDKLILIDELLTPDSSRFWDQEGYSPGKSQPNFDKQFVRDWLTESGWNREPPAPPLPSDIVEKTCWRYLEAYRRLTGEALE